VCVAELTSLFYHICVRVSRWLFGGR